MSIAGTFFFHINRYFFAYNLILWLNCDWKKMHVWILRKKKEERKEESVGLTRKSNNLNDSLIILTSYVFTNCFGHSQLRNQHIIHCSLTYNANVRNFSPFRKHIKKIWELMWNSAVYEQWHLFKQAISMCL